MELSMQAEGKEEIATSQEQRVGEEEWWKIELQRREVPACSLAGLRHLDTILEIQHLCGTCSRQDGWLCFGRCSFPMPLLLSVVAFLNQTFFYFFDSCSVVSSSLRVLLGILQARIPEWLAIPFSRGSSQPRGQIQVSGIAGGFLTSWVMREARDYWSG